MLMAVALGSRVYSACRNLTASKEATSPASVNVTAIVHSTIPGGDGTDGGVVIMSSPSSPKPVPLTLVPVANTPAMVRTEHDDALPR